MGNRRDEGFGSGFGTSGYDPHAQWEGPVGMRGVGREPSRVRRYHADEEMGGADWSGREGEGPYGQSSRYGHYGQSPWGPREREHGGFSNYAGGGDRDRDRDDFRRFSPRDRDERDFGEYAREREGWHGGYSGGYGRGRFGMSAHRGEHEWSPMMDRYAGYPDYAYGGLDRFEPRWGRGFAGSDMGMGMGLDRDEERGPYYGRGPKGYKRSDERIREDLCEVISRQGFIDSSDVEVVVEGGVVRLAGTVPHRHDKRTLEQIAERIHGVDEVRNELRLRRERLEGEGFQGRHEQHRVQPHNGKNARS